MTGPDEVFAHERPRLLGLAYRITGSRADAEDVVQDAWLRWERAGPETVERPPAWLTTVTSRLALDRLRSAQHTREAYVGPWLPEVVTAEDGPAETAELAESLTVGFLTVLERLAPVERVVFLLADVFDVPFAEIATTVDKTPEACRQIASRARRRVRDERRRFTATGDEAWAVTLQFLAAAQAGDLDALVRLLSEDAMALSDGGRDHHAARRPVVGPDRVARLVANLTRRAAEDDTLEVELRAVNGQPGVVFRRAGRPVVATSIEVADGRVSTVYSVVNPDKLTALDATPVT